MLPSPPDWEAPLAAADLLCCPVMKNWLSWWSRSPSIFILGEPPASAHPTVWMGRVTALLEKRAPRSRKAGFIAGAVITLFLAAFWAAAAYFVAAALKDIHTLAYILMGGMLLKTTFSVRLLHREAAKVRRLLVLGDLPGVRAQMPALVSRDPSQLTPEQATAGDCRVGLGKHLRQLLRPLAGLRPVRTARRLCLPGHQHLGQHDRLPWSLRIPGQDSGPPRRLGQPGPGPAQRVAAGGRQRASSRPAGGPRVANHVAASPAAPPAPTLAGP